MFAFCFSISHLRYHTHLKIPHYPARVDRPHRPEQREQLPVSHVLRQIVDDQIRQTAAADAIVRGARSAGQRAAGQPDAAQRRRAGRGQVMVRIVRLVLLLRVV